MHTFLDALCQRDVIVYELDKGSHNFTINRFCAVQPSTYPYVIVSNTTEVNRRKIIELAPEVSSAEETEALLELVQWKIFVQSCQAPCDNFTKLETLLGNFCPNSSCRFSDRIDEILQRMPDCSCSSCSSFTKSFIISKWGIFLALGILSLIGNIIVIFDKITRLRKSQNKGKEVQIYYILVLNLATADLLMGIYLTAVAFEIRHKVYHSQFFSNPEICNVLGVINALSTQVSITVLLIISIYRLVGVVYPYRNQHVKVVVSLLPITWVLWLIIAILPLIPLDPLKTSFTFGLAKQQMLEIDSLIDFMHFTPLLERILNLVNVTHYPEVHSVLLTIIQFPTVSVLQKATAVLGLVNFSTEGWSLVGYYDLQYACATNFFLTAENQGRRLNLFTLSFVIYNFMSTIAIFITYVLVTCKISGTVFAAHICNGISLGKRSLQKNLPNSELRSNENRQVLNRISFIILTNLFCWLPLCIAALVIGNVHVGTSDARDVLRYVLSIQTAMLLIVPFNSILNPYIYSYHLFKALFAKMRKKITF